tara:strand:+ start:7894 stop:8280 length:387 start_codon:yes stop_codon:yes gene_type:complete
MPKITPKQAAFVKEYLIDRNGTQAAIRAGYSKKTAKEQSSQLLTKLHVQQAVKEGEAKHAGRCDVTLDSLTGELDEALGMARQQEDSNALRQAAMAKAKLHGFDIVKTENKHDGGLIVELVRFTDAKG